MGRYKISEIARYRGISPNGIVYLEKKGVLKSVRDESNGYRYYDEDAFTALAVINVYQQLGMSLDSAHTLYGSDPTSTLYALQQNRRTLENDYLRKMKILKRLQKNLETALQLNGRFEICRRPALWLLPISPPCPNAPIEKRAWKRWEELNNEWDRQMPFVRYAVYYDSPGSEPMRCSIAEVEDAKALRLSDKEPVIKLSPYRCAHTVIPLLGGNSPQDPFRTILDFLCEHALEPCGPLVGRILHSYLQNNVLNSYVEFWVPVKETRSTPVPESK